MVEQVMRRATSAWKDEDFLRRLYFVVFASADVTRSGLEWDPSKISHRTRGYLLLRRLLKFCSWADRMRMLES